MKHIYIILLACANIFAIPAIAQQNTNSNSPSDKKKATIEVQFRNNNSVQVKSIKNNSAKINQVILNFEDGSQEKFSDIDKNAVNISNGNQFNYAGDIIGVWVADDENITLLGDSTGYGEYIMNTDFFVSDFHDDQSDRGNPNWSGNTKHCKPEYEPFRMGHKVLICKVPPGNPENFHNIWVACAAVEAHLRTGSVLGDCDDFVIPVELIRFEGKVNDKQEVVLQWATASEINNHFFNIERSTNGEEFETIGRVLGNGNSETIIEYDFIDQKPLAGRSFYRLKQVDYDGTFEYSKIVAVSYTTMPEDAVQVYPNPCYDGNCNLTLATDAREDVTVNIFNMNGVLVHSLEVNGRDHGSIDIASFNLSSGMYIISVKTNNNVINKRLVIR